MPRRPTPVNKRRPGRSATARPRPARSSRRTAGDWDGTVVPAPGTASSGSAARLPVHDPKAAILAVWVNNTSRGQGVCVDGCRRATRSCSSSTCVDAQFDGNACANPPVRPLELRAPGDGADRPRRRADRRHATTPRQRRAGPRAHAITGGASMPPPAATARRRHVRPGRRVTLKAEKSGLVRSAAEKVAVSAPGPAPAGPRRSRARHRRAGRARSAGSAAASASRARRPRTLRGTVSPDPSGLRMVKLSLTRSSGGRCQLYSPHPGALPQLALRAPGELLDRRPRGLELPAARSGSARAATCST